jgi:magnesium-transporting ATPase (P-type)
MIFSSTYAAKGSGIGIVVAIGVNTEIGKINHMV